MNKISMKYGQISWVKEIKEFANQMQVIEKGASAH